MRRFRRTVGLLAAASLVAVGAPALAAHGDPIPEKIPVSDAEFDLELTADGFTTPVLGTHAPGNNKQLFVVDQVGTITAVKLRPGHHGSVPDSFTFLDVGASGLGLLVPLGAFGPGSFDERGFLGLAFHPKYRKNGLLYTYSSEPLDSGTPDFPVPTGDAPADNASLSVIREWRVDKPKRPGSVVDPASSRVLLRVQQPQFNHNGGALAFGPDHKLYIALGDGGMADDQGPGHAPGGNGQDLSDGNVLGKILRIDPLGSNSANGEYGIPASNPFVDQTGADEIFAYGLRNPFRMSFDSKTGKLYAADVGQNDIEEVDVIVKGGNYGWPIKEGTFLFDMNGDEDGFTGANSPGVPAGLIDPIAQYDHDEGISVTGGFVYRGDRIKDLRGSYVFGDFTASFAGGPQGRIFHIDKHGQLAELVPASGPAGMFVTGFGQDRKGELYVMGQQGATPVGNTGQVFKLTRLDDREVELEAELSSDNEVPPSGTGASGEAEVELDPRHGQVCVEIESEDLAGDVVAGHIHVGPAGVNGPVVVDLGVDSDDFEACVAADPALIRTIARNPGGYYVNVHTTVVPSGEIRGQLERE